MDKNKLEISGKTSPEATSATYKPIPEQDMEEQALSRPKSFIKVKASPEECDGADQKMLPNEEKVSEVVVMNNDAKSPQNGDAKLDMDEPKQAYIGLTKDELMKYANDPFWVRLRWFLFISFWLLWASMLIGAVMIIYAAPKCNPPPPRTWYQQGPLTKLSPDTKPENVKLDKNIKGVIISWTTDAYESLEKNPDGLALIKAVQKEGANVIVELEPAVSNVWFEQSEAKIAEFDGYYIWKTGSNKGTDNIPLPPNNWVSPNNVSSWKYSDTRKEFYYSPFAKPHLNFRYSPVIDQFSKVIERFLAVNVSGFRLRNAPFLLVDPTFENEDANNNSNFTLGQYGFLKHSKTENLADLGSLLNTWRRLIKNKTEDGTLMVAEDLAKPEAFKFNQSLVVDMPLMSHIFSKPTLSVNETVNSLNYAFNINRVVWPLWEAKTTALPDDVLSILTFLLPGAPLVNLTEKFDSNTTRLLDIRNSASIMRGMCGVYGLQNNTILAFIRVTPGNPGILVAVNPTNTTAVANFPAEIPLLSDVKEVTVTHYSRDYNEAEFRDIGGKKIAAAVPVTLKSAIVLEYVPKME